MSQSDRSKYRDQSVSFERLMTAARRTNRERDEMDRKMGVATPLDVGPTETVRTAIAALEAGLKMRSLTAMAEAVAMLEEMLQELCGDGDGNEAKRPIKVS